MDEIFFISYRQGDHIDVVLALGHRLVESLGSDQGGDRRRAAV